MKYEDHNFFVLIYFYIFIMHYINISIQNKIRIIVAVLYFIILSLNNLRNKEKNILVYRNISRNYEINKLQSVYIHFQ